jgi:hypothetical protein
MLPGSVAADSRYVQFITEADGSGCGIPLLKCVSYGKFCDLFMYDSPGVVTDGVVRVMNVGPPDNDRDKHYGVGLLLRKDLQGEAALPVFLCSCNFLFLGERAFSQTINTELMLMKKSLLALGVFTTFAGSSFSQTQIGNSAFEAWEVVASPDEEPVNWSSFLTASGSLAQFAQSELDKSTDVRPGSTGTYSAHIFSQNVLGVIANGNVTTGRINMGSATPSSANNYNSSVIADASFSEALADYPDSLVFWAKFTPINAADSARVSAILHDNYAFRDPIDGASAPHMVASAMRNYITTNGQWVRFSVPFTYSGPASTPAFLLITFTTNKTPGGGSGNDQVWIDDVELIYNPGSNLPIIANDDVAATDEDTPVPISVLLNDIDPENDIDTASINIVTNGSNGTATVNTTTGVITYTPNSAFTGTDSFVYEICDGDTGNPTCDDATVTVTVSAVGGIGETSSEKVRAVIADHTLSIFSAIPLSGTMAVYASSGQLVYEGDINSHFTFSDSGLYIVRIVSNLGTTVQKVVNN